MKEYTKDRTLIVKGVAIMLLLMYHLFHEKYVLEEMGVNHAPLSQETFLNLAGFGNICVAIFVMLTAYGISTGIFKEVNLNTKNEFQKAGRRFAKLMLNFFVVYVTINAICFPFLNYGSLYGEGKQSVLLMLCDALGLSSTLQTPMLNGTWWYMKLAYILIFLVPCMAFLAKKTGTIFLLLAFFTPFVIPLDSDVERYFFVAAFGVVAALGRWPEKVMNSKIPGIIWWLLAAVGSVLMVLVRQNALVKDYFWNYADAFIAFFIICATTMTVGNVPVLNTVLKFLGKHSMNIFLVHTMFYMVAFRKYIYHFKYAAVTFVILLGVSLVYSVILETAKKGVEKIFEILVKKAKKG